MFDAAYGDPCAPRRCFVKDKAVDLFLLIARVYPNYHPVTDRLTWWLEADGRKDEAAVWRVCR